MRLLDVAGRPRGRRCTGRSVASASDCKNAAALISFVPQFKIEGPETFDRFQTAAMTGQAICLAVGFLFFIKDFRNGWPYLLAGSFFVLNEVIKSFLTSYNLIEPLTEFVGSMSQPYTFIGSFAVLLSLLATTGLQIARPSKV